MYVYSSLQTVKSREERKGEGGGGKGKRMVRSTVSPKVRSTSVLNDFIQYNVNIFVIL